MASRMQRFKVLRITVCQVQRLLKLTPLRFFNASLRTCAYMTSTLKLVLEFYPPTGSTKYTHRIAINVGILVFTFHNIFNKIDLN